MSLSKKEAAFLDAYAESTGARSRSAVVRRALELLRTEDLEGAYELAWRDWAPSEDAALWEGTSADGLDDAPR